MKNIPYSHQSINSVDIRQVTEVLKSDWLTQGPRIKEFEDALCEYTGAKYAVAVSSGTAALHLAVLALDVGKQDKLLTSPVTFSASANCALYVGAKPEFIDIDDNTYHLDIHRLEDFLKVPSQKEGVKVVILVHFMGTVADIVAIREICERYGIRVVEDAAHAMGGRYKVGDEWIDVGSCSHSDITVFSFHPIKHITTGEGGAVLCNDRTIYESVLRFRHHGITKEDRAASSLLQSCHEQDWYYDIRQVGFNYRITDFQCALGVSQLYRLNSMVERRRELVRLYNIAFAGIEQIRLPYERGGSYASYHLYVIRVPPDSRDGLYRYLRDNGVYCQVNYIPAHLFTFYQRELRCQDGDFPVAERFFRECLSLPLYPTLSDWDQRRVIDTIRKFFGYE